MTTVIGLFRNDENIQSSIDRLQDAGLAADKIRIFTSYDDVQKLFSGNESHLVVRYVVWGAVLGIAIFNLYGLALGGYACHTILGYLPSWYWLCDIVGFTVLGLILGASAGFFVGVTRFEGGADLYTHGINRGDKLMAVQVDDEPAANKVKRILDQARARGIKLFRDLADVSPS